jgi:hypothetical protein
MVLPGTPQMTIKYGSGIMHFAYRKTKKIFVFHFYENLFYKTLMNK